MFQKILLDTTNNCSTKTLDLSEIFKKVFRIIIRIIRVFPVGTCNHLILTIHNASSIYPEPKEFFHNNVENSCSVHIYINY